MNANTAAALAVSAVLVASAVTAWAYAPQVLGRVRLGYVQNGNFVPIDISKFVRPPPQKQ